jgi:hypothetical protein
MSPRRLSLLLAVRLEDGARDDAERGAQDETESDAADKNAYHKADSGSHADQDTHSNMCAAHRVLLLCHDGLSAGLG